MADAGGVVYLLSSYQSSKERWGHRVGERVRERYNRKGKKGRGEHLVLVEADFWVALIIQGTVCMLPFDLPGFMWGAWYLWCGRSVIIPLSSPTATLCNTQSLPVCFRLNILSDENTSLRQLHSAVFGSESSDGSKAMWMTARRWLMKRWEAYARKKDIPNSDMCEKSWWKLGESPLTRKMDWPWSRTMKNSCL